MTSSFQSYLPYLPYIILGFLVTAGALLLRILYAYSSTVQKTELLKRSLTAPLSFFKRSSPLTTEQKDQDPETPKQTFFERSKFFLTNFWRSSDQEDLSLSFQEAMKILKEHFTTRNFKYKLPWYLIIGSVDSGKTKLLEDLSLDLPVGRPHFNIDDDRPSCKWWFFDRALIIDTIGDYLLPKQGLKADAKGWAFLMHLMVRHRLKRPLDGIILTIPADELIGPHKLGYDDILLRAKQLNAKLWHLQYSLAMKVPVYLLITKSDHIEGFKEFSNELPLSALNRMLGWTCPYSLEVQYSSSWIDEIFSFINKSLHKTRAEIFTEGKVKQGRDGTFVFKVEIQKLKENLGVYLNNIFKETTYHESFFLRGVYFCGDTGNHTAVGDHKRDERYWIPPESLGSAVEIPFKNHDKRQISFIHDLFEHKIFREHALARPVRRMLISTSKALNLAKIIVAGIVLSWGIGLYRAHDRFEVGSKALLPLVQEVDQTIHNINRRNFDLTMVSNATYLNDQALRILKLMSDLNLESSFSLSIPASWFTTYDDDIRSAITTAWDNVILKSFYSGLIQKARKLFIMLDDTTPNDNKIYLNPLKTPEFNQLKNFVEETAKLEDQVIRFNNLGVSENIDDIGRLINYLFDRDLPKQFYENTSYYQTALSQATERKIKILDFSTSARRKLSLLFNEFLDSSLKLSNENGVLAMLIEALNSLSQVTATRNPDENKISNNIQTIFSAAESIRDKEFNWIEGDVFLPGEAYTTSINVIANSRILGVAVTNELLVNAQKAFTSYKQSLTQLDAPLIGKIFAIKNNALTADPSHTYETLLENLSAFLKQPFMKKQGAYKAIMPIPPGRLLLWDETALASAGKLVQAYEKYATEALPAIPTETRHIIEVLGRNALSRKIFHMIANAETFQVAPQTATGFDEQEALNQQVQNLKVAQPQFNILLSGYLRNDASNQGSQLRNLLVNQGHELLHMIDNLLTRDDLYSVGEDLFSWWDGQEMLGLRAFGVYDIDDMKGYLSAQFARIRFLGKDLADPLLSYLSLPYLHGAPRNIPLISKWTRILTQIDAYEKQSPSNSISILEHFLMYDLNQINESMCVDAVLAYDIYEKTGDYFLDRRNKIRRAMIHRCESIARHRSIENYNELAAFFNRYLAGRFPFSSESEFYGTNEASVDDVNTFLVLFDKINESQRKALDELIDFPNPQSSPSKFLRQIDLLRPILSAALDANADQYVPKLDFAVDFRTDRNQETEGNKIIDWNLQINETDIDFRDDKRVGQWVVGNPLCVILRWASDGPTSPTLDERQPNLTTSNHTARFSYEGRWSLIRLLKAHAIDYKTYEKGKPTPVTLQFMVPTVYKKAEVNQASQKTTAAKVFLRFSLFDPTKKLSPAAVPEKIKTDAAAPVLMEKNLLPLPIFPLKAPAIETRLQDQKNKSFMGNP
jgi:type VI secretion system protein ImpL